MASINPKTLPELSQSAIALDDDFLELEQLAGYLEHASIETEAGLERAKGLLVKFGETGARIGEGIQRLSKALNDSRTRAEAAADVVSRCAANIQSRQQKNEELLGRFRDIGENVRAITTEVSHLRKAEGQEFSADEKAHMPEHLARLDAQLAQVIEQARVLKLDAHDANMKNLERDADSLTQSMSAARRRLSGFLSEPTSVGDSKTVN